MGMSAGGNALIMRKMNVDLVRKALREKKRATKLELAQATGLSTMTVSTVLRELVAQGLAEESGAVASSGGRRALQYRFNENHAHVLALYTNVQDGADMLHVRVANLYGACVESSDAPLAEITLRSFEPFIDRSLKSFPSIKAVGFGLPGSERGGKVICADYPALRGQMLTAHYSGRYNLPVLFENDVNAAVVGYCARRRMQSQEATVYLYFPKKYPPGAGIAIGGRLYKGSNHFAGEIAAFPAGTDWADPALYAAPPRFREAAAGLITAICRMIDPATVVLQGDFLSPCDLEPIRRRCEALLPQCPAPELLLSENFSQDYQFGVIEAALTLLEPRLSLSAKG